MGVVVDDPRLSAASGSWCGLDLVNSSIKTALPVLLGTAATVQAQGVGKSICRYVWDWGSGTPGSEVVAQSDR
jgi:hypothetical protein